MADKAIIRFSDKSVSTDDGNLLTVRKWWHDGIQETAEILSMSLRHFDGPVGLETPGDRINDIAGRGVSALMRMSRHDDLMIVPTKACKRHIAIYDVMSIDGYIRVRVSVMKHTTSRWIMIWEGHR